MLKFLSFSWPHNSYFCPEANLNPGPLHSEFVCPSERLGFCNESFSSLDSESDGHVSFASQFNSSVDSLDDSEPHLHFSLDLPSKRLRIGHWNVNHLTSSKFDQIKMLLNNKDGTPQVDVLWLNETFLKAYYPGHSLCSSWIYNLQT